MVHLAHPHSKPRYVDFILILLRLSEMQRFALPFLHVFFLLSWSCTCLCPVATALGQRFQKTERTAFVSLLLASMGSVFSASVISVGGALKSDSRVGKGSVAQDLCCYPLWISLLLSISSPPPTPPPCRSMNTARVAHTLSSS